MIVRRCKIDKNSETIFIKTRQEDIELWREILKKTGKRRSEEESS